MSGFGTRGSPEKNLACFRTVSAPGRSLKYEKAWSGLGCRFSPVEKKNQTLDSCTRVTFGSEGMAEHLPLLPCFSTPRK